MSSLCSADISMETGSLPSSYSYTSNRSVPLGMSGLTPRSSFSAMSLHSMSSLSEMSSSSGILMSATANETFEASLYPELMASEKKEDWMSLTKEEASG